MKKSTKNLGTLNETKLLGEVKMDLVARQMLIYQYPTIRLFIEQCFNSGDEQKVIDFLFSLETDSVYHKGH